MEVLDNQDSDAGAKMNIFSFGAASTSTKRSIKTSTRESNQYLRREVNLKNEISQN